MKLFCLLLLAGLIAFGLWERSSLATLRAENAALHEQQSAAQALADENAAMTKRLGEAPASNSGANKSELLRLRNDVRRLRSQPGDPARLRAENDKLAADLKSGQIRPQRLADQAGFVGRDSWANVGAATPEAALQSVLCAVRDANLELLIQLINPNEAGAMRREMEKDPIKMRNDFARETSSQFAPSGFVIVGREEAAGDKAILRVKFSAQGQPLEMEFQRMDGTWRMTKGF